MANASFVTCLIAVIVGLTSAYRPECAVGPAYWCQSFQNAQDCGALRHCTDTVWRHDDKRTQVDSSTKCEWCREILENTHKAIENIASNEDLVQSTLINGCKLLPLEDVSTKCTQVIQTYGTIVLSLMKDQRYDTLCHLMDICPKVDEQRNTDDQSKMLCNVLVRATHELHVNLQKNRDETQSFLRNDCQQLQTSQLVGKCEDLVERHGAEIYAHVASNIELSKICDYLETSALQSTPSAPYCELCTVVLSLAKQMVDAKQPEEKVLLYIDEQICSRLTGEAKQNCRAMIDANGRDLLQNIEQGMQPTLLCTHFQVCLDQIVQPTSPIQKDEMRSFLQNQLCAKLGSLQSACEALIEKDGTHLLQILTNEIDGKELCQIFGLCPSKSLLLTQLNVKDDPTKCKRCVTDFTRRKHIAERLVNRSSEYLHRLCEQLPEKDDCIKGVDDSTNELRTFIHSLDPRAICIQLNMCDQRLAGTVESNAIKLSENVMNEEVLDYIKIEVCPKLDSLSSLCIQLVDSEGTNLLNLIDNDIDSHRVCEILDICPSNWVMKNCHDKCQCCANKIEIYQNRVEKFMRAMISSTRIMCDYVPGRDRCLHLADVFESNVEKAVARLDSKKTCQLLRFCTPSEENSNEDQCETCKTEITTRQNHFRTTVNQLSGTLLPLCEDQNCRLQIQSIEEETMNKISKVDTQSLCQRLGYCLAANSWEPSATLLRLRSLVQHQIKSLDERLEAHHICSEYGQFKDICENLMTSVYSRRYAHVYSAILKNNPKLIDDDLREQMQTKAKIDVCDSCKNAVQSSKDFWKKALDSVLNVLLRTCDYCSVKTECQAYYHRRFDGIKSYLDNIDPTQFCQTLHLCSTSVIDSQTNSEEEESHEYIADSNSTCILCEQVMNVLANYIHQESTEEEIEQSLQRVCNQMPSTLRNQCHQLIENYGPPIIATLIRDFDVSTVCRKLNLCTNQIRIDSSDMVKADQAACGVCDYVSAYVHFALKRDSSERSLQQALETVCTHLSSTQTSHCQAIVPLIRSNVRQLQLGSGNEFCKQLPICQTPMIELQPAIHLNHQSTVQKEEQFKQMVIQNIDEAPECMLCRYVVSYLDAFLKNNKSEAAVEAALAKVCTILPRKERVSCAQFIQTYGRALAELIVEVADPQLVCRYLGLCQAVSSQDVKPTTYSNHHYARIPV